MYAKERSLREERFQQEKKNPSFSSTLLAEIYRSIDEGNSGEEKLALYREGVMKKKQSMISHYYNVRSSVRGFEEEEDASLKRTSLIEKWMEQRVNEKLEMEKKRVPAEMDRKFQYDNDPLFFSSSSISSESSSGGFSSSEGESVQELKKTASCFLPAHPKPVRCSSVSYRSEKRLMKTEDALFLEQRKLHTFDNNNYHDEEGLNKSKSRALKMYANLKKVKQPISPGGKLTNFLNLIFTAGHAKKSKTPSSPSTGGQEKRTNETKKLKLQSESTCSSASSFTRSCLSKNAPTTREKLRNGAKRSVRFYPVSVIVDEDCRPCGHKSLEAEDSGPTSLGNIMNLTTRKNAEELKIQAIEKNRQALEIAAARDLLRIRHQNAAKESLISSHNKFDNDEENDEDDAASDASSDLFEIDHLAFIDNSNVSRYCEELPVYETTHVHRNRAIASGLML